MKNIIIDCDPGHDDAIAILLALANKDKLNVLGITCVAGNQTIEKVTNNALKIVEFLNEDIKVYSGQSKPLIRELKVSDKIHGQTGMDIKSELRTNRVKKNTHAVNFIADMAKKYEDKITLVAIAPLTNIALFIKLYPDLLNRIEEISLMGGGLLGGNITSSSEFNFYVDPEAAKIVFESGIKITMSGLHMTSKAFIKKEEYEIIRNRGKASKIMSELIDFLSIHNEQWGYENAMHDSCAVLYLLKPEIFTEKQYHIDIITDSEHCRGLTLVDYRPKIKNNNINVLMTIKREPFKDFLFESIHRLDKSLN